MTDAGMMECKKALVEADGDMDKAVDVLRTRGLAAAAKKVGRATNEGTVMAIVSDDATKGAVVELNCETDFVGMNEKFKGYAEKIARAAMAANVEDVEALKAVDAEGETVEDVLTDAIHTLGENMNLARAGDLQGSGCRLRQAREHSGEDRHWPSREVLQGELPHRAGFRQEPGPERHRLRQRGRQEARRHHQGDRLQALHARRIVDALFLGASAGFRPCAATKRFTCEGSHCAGLRFL